MTPPSLRQLLLGSVSLAILPAGFARAQSLPHGGAYVAGAGSIATGGRGVTVNQSSSRGIINWQGFSIGPGNKVQFNNGTGATLNRVTGGNLSKIEGALSATGSVYLINPAGVVVGPNGRVVTGGSFVASTRDVASGAFMAGGTQTLSGTSAGTVANAGQIVSQGGDVVLIGEAVTNTGGLSAPNGTAALAAGTTVVLSAASGPGGIYVAPDPTAKGDATNSGRIKAAAAELASAGGNVYALSGNRAGLVQATGTKTIDGQVWLTAPNGTTTANGTVQARNADGSGGTIVANGHAVAVGATARFLASATRAGKAGGTILVGVSGPGGVNEAKSTSIASGARIRATGKAGGAGGHIETSGATLSIGAATVNAGAGGSWLLDPTDLTIDAAAATTIAGSLNAGTNVTEMTVMSGAASGSGVQTAGAGDITVAAPIAWTGKGVLTMNAYNSVNINAAITIGGAGGLSLSTNVGQTGGTGTLNFNGGSVSYTQGAGGSLSINGNPYTLVFDLATLGSDVAANPGGFYALGASINAAGTTYTTEPVTTVLTGTFEGLGNTISNLTINSPDDAVGLFAVQQGASSIRDIGLVGGSVTGTAIGGTVGGLVGLAVGGSIVNASTTGNVTAETAAGGLVGQLEGATITNSYATGSVTARDASSVAGGLVGKMIPSGGGLPTITNSYATGTVAANNLVGGLVGDGTDETANATNVYATGAVTVGAGGYGGGLFGGAGGTLTNVYSTGTVKGVGATIGGLIGYQGGTVTNGYWNVDRSGVTAAVGAGSSAGITGLSAATASPFTAASYAGLTFTTTPGTAGNAWVIVDIDGSLNNANGAAGGTLPMLASEYTTTIVNAHQLQLMAMAPAASYTLGGTVAAAATGSSTSAITGTDVWGPNGFIPVGNTTAMFTGGFNGAGYTITNLTVNSPYDAGLFGDIGAATIQNVGLVGGSVTGTGNGVGDGVAGAGNVGFLAGYAAGQVINAYATGSVTGMAGTTGGLIGFSEAPVSNSYATGTVTGVSGEIGGLIGLAFSNVSGAHATGAVSGSGSVGGLVGSASIITLTNSYATGPVTGSGNVGGLVGYNQFGPISGSYATGNVSASGASKVGGLVGYLQGDESGNVIIANSYATGAVSASGASSNVGGLIGNFSYADVITTSYATGPVTATGASSNTGGLIGYLYNNATVTASYASGNVSGSGSSNVGGLVGLSTGTNSFAANAITNSTATGTVSGAGSVGGLVGNNTYSSITGSHATGAVTLLFGSLGGGYVGGLAGFNGTGGTITNSYATGTVTYASSQGAAGGLVGSNISTITGAYATGAVVSNGYGGTLGGLVGFNTTGGTIANSYASGAVSATGTASFDSIASLAGGLVGDNAGSITNSYSTGATVANAGTSYVGGLVGVNSGSIANAYATGAVVGAGPDSDVGGLVGVNAAGSIATSYAAGPVIAIAPYAGGLVGANTGSITSSYWDIDRALTSVGVGNGSATGATGLSGAAVFNAASYAGFTFTTTPGAAGNAWVVVNLDGTLNGANGGTLPLLASEYASTIVNAHQLQLMVLAPNAGYTLATNIDATATGSSISPATGADVWGPAGFIPVGNTAKPFAGLFEGNNFVINGLTINSAAAAVGLFGVADAEIQDVGLSGGSITGSGAADVGALVGSAGGSVSKAYSTVAVAGTGFVGGLIGLNTAQLTNVYASGAVTATTGIVGGLVGTNTSFISNAYATGVVTGGPTTTYAGGLAGSNSGLLANAYATGAISAPVGGMGGLVGSNSGSVSNAYATGAVGFSSQAGGVAGFNTGSFSNVYWNIDRVGRTNAVGLEAGGATAAGTTGLSAGTASPLNAASYAGFTFTTTPGAKNGAWVIVDVDGTLNNAGGAAGATLPMLASEYSTSIVNAHQLQLVAMAPAANYTLATNIDASATGTGVRTGVVNGASSGTDVWGASGFVPLGGNGAANFTGSFNGQGNAISDLTINSSARNVGLFGQIDAFGQSGPGGTVTNLGLLNAAVVASTAMGGGNAVGALVGQNYGTIANSYATGAVVATNVDFVGGLIGATIDGSINNSYETASVTAKGFNQATGGFVGMVGLTPISNAYATGSVSTNYVAGVGGFSGAHDVTATNVYATGLVSGVGTLYGFASNSIAIPSGYYDVDRTGAGNETSSGTALSGEAAFTAASYAGFNFTNTPGAQGNAWVIVDVDGTLNNAGGAAGATLPMLASEYNARNIVNAHQLQLLAMAPGASYTLGRNIDASATGSSTSATTGTDVWGSTGFAPIGGAAFNGVLNGHGSTISGLSINSSVTNVGLFGINNGVVQNLALAGGAITSSLPTGSIGALAGANGGLIETVATTAPVTASATGQLLSAFARSAAAQAAGNTLGGVAGQNSGAILNVAARDSITDNTPGSAVGGAVGANNGVVVQSYAVGAVTGATIDTSNGAVGGLVGSNTGKVTLSYAASATTGGNVASIGGLVGSNAGTILNAYATGTVGGGDATSTIGGLVGTNSATGSITDTYATGAISASGTVGGLVAVSTGTVTASYWDETMTGTATSAAGTGLTTQQFLTLGPVASAAFNTGTVWVGGYAYPVLQALPYVLVTATGTQVYGSSNATYTVTGAIDQNGANASGRVNTSSTVFLTSATAGSPVVGNPYVLGGTGGTVPVGYQLTYTGAFTVTPEGLTPETVGLTGSVSKTYDGTTTAILTQANYTLNGGSAPSGVTVSATSTLYATPDAGSGIVITASGLSLSGANASNYALTSTTASGAIGTITAAPLIVTGSKIYDSTTGFAVGQLGVAGAVNNETISLTAGSGTAASANVGLYGGSTLTGLAITVTGGNALASNYTLPGTGTLTITAEPITIAAAPNTKTYDGTTAAAATPTITTGTIYDPATLSEAYATPNAGTGLTLIPTATIANAGNYSVTYAPSTSGIITPAPLIVTGGKVYDSTSGFTVGQLAIAGGVNGESVALSAGSGTTSSANAGTYAGSILNGLAITVTGGNALASNYALPGAGTLTITAEPITIAAAPNTKTYDGTTTAAATPTVTSGTLYDASQLSETYATANAGTGLTLTPIATIATAGNYSITYAANTAGIISPAPLTVAGSKVYDTTTGFAVSQLGVTGGVNGESVTLTAGHGTAASANVGAYSGSTLAGLAITVTGGNARASNYVLPATGTLGITPEAITIAAAPNTKTYDGTTTAAATPIVTFGTLYDPATLTETYATANAGTGLTLTPFATIAAAGNYSVTYAASTAGIISPATLTAGLTGTVAKTYDGTTLATLVAGNYTLSGVIGKDSVTLNTPISGSYATANAGTAIPVTVSGLALTGAAANDYMLAATTASAPIGTIAPATLTASLTGSVAATATGSTTASLTPANYVLSGVVPGDSVTLNDPATGSYATGSPGTGITVTVSGLALGGPQASDYTLSATSVSAMIGTLIAPPPIVPPPLTPVQPILPATLLPVPAGLPQQGVVSADNGLLLLAGNGFGPLPAIISASDAAGTIMLPDGIAISTGLPLLVGPEQSLVITDGDRHLIIRLPAPTMPAPTPGGAL